MSTLHWHWRADADTAALFAIIGVDTGGFPDASPMVFDMLLRVDAETVITERPTAKRVYVIYWPGVLEIPWPEGMTAQEAVLAWRRGMTPETVHGRA